MTEEINYSYDGGLYAEMVSNRTFHSDWSGVQPRTLVRCSKPATPRPISKWTRPPAPAPPFRTASSLPSSTPAGRRKPASSTPATGAWPCRPSTTYQGSFYAKAVCLGPVTVSIVNDSIDQTIATTTISAPGSSWKQYEFTLKTGAIEPSAANHLEITVAHPGILWLNLVSLFPPTYNDRVNGNRIDLMEKLAAMHPPFLRFPGGNYLEGDHIPIATSGRRPSARSSTAPRTPARGATTPPTAWASSNTSNGAKTCT